MTGSRASRCCCLLAGLGCSVPLTAPVSPQICHSATCSLCQWIQVKRWRGYEKAGFQRSHQPQVVIWDAALIRMKANVSFQIMEPDRKIWNAKWARLGFLWGIQREVILCDCLPEVMPSITVLAFNVSSHCWLCIQYHTTNPATAYTCNWSSRRCCDAQTPLPRWNSHLPFKCFH